MKIGLAVALSLVSVPAQAQTADSVWHMYVMDYDDPTYARDFYQLGTCTVLIFRDGRGVWLVAEQYVDKGHGYDFYFERRIIDGIPTAMQTLYKSRKKGHQDLRDTTYDVFEHICAEHVKFLPSEVKKLFGGLYRSDE